MALPVGRRALAELESNMGLRISRDDLDQLRRDARRRGQTIGCHLVSVPPGSSLLSAEALAGYEAAVGVADEQAAAFYGRSDPPPLAGSGQPVARLPPTVTFEAVCRAVKAMRAAAGVAIQQVCGPAHADLLAEYDQLWSVQAAFARWFGRLQGQQDATRSVLAHARTIRHEHAATAESYGRAMAELEAEMEALVVGYAAAAQGAAAAEASARSWAERARSAERAVAALRDEARVPSAAAGAARLGTMLPAQSEPGSRRSSPIQPWTDAVHAKLWLVHAAAGDLMKLLDPVGIEHGLDVRVLNTLEGWTGRMGSAYECAKRTVGVVEEVRRGQRRCVCCPDALMPTEWLLVDPASAPPRHLPSPTPPPTPPLLLLPSAQPAIRVDSRRPTGLERARRHRRGHPQPPPPPQPRVCAEAGLL